MIEQSWVEATEDHEPDDVGAAASGTYRVRVREVSAWQTASAGSTEARVTRLGIECSQVPYVPAAAAWRVSRTRAATCANIALHPTPAASLARRVRRG